ncbi:hypothetical protein SAMN05920897_107140 [Alkalispirochaeta americana]|uniref:MetA-pathway of phenol degradation n=1 Tax=Alkalispirochaeta americana TaxID=159291 RepID=A0A1N6S4U8_9SPIO|nr:hypothetical protein [Alkalispirochaeta americana]SIQ36124.1 hypothetical protein SAMN05920897_107140 [Alkalispirochaeta americana]
MIKNAVKTGVTLLVAAWLISTPLPLTAAPAPATEEPAPAATLPTAPAANATESDPPQNPEKPQPPLIIPLFTYRTLSVSDQTLHSPGSGIVFLAEDHLLAGTYSRTTWSTTPGTNRDKDYHTLEFLYDGARRKHRYLTVLQSASDKPIHGGTDTFQAAALYGYEIFATPSTSIVLGGGLGISDFGLKTPNGQSIYALPLPLIRLTHEDPRYHLSLEFITGPTINLTLAPEENLRMTWNLRFDLDQLRDERDLFYEIALHYRFASLGIQNETISFDLAGEKDPLESTFYSAFAEVDLILLKLRAGYAFDTLLRSVGTTEQTGDGLYLSLQGLIPLGSRSP